MPSSTFSSESAKSESASFHTASAERATAADRPGVAQPVPERPLPAQPWGRIFLGALALVLIAVGAWEWRMRGLGLVAGDLDDGPSLWAEQRRRIDNENVQIAIIGDSRILFDTDLDRFEAMTGVRPVQLALPGTNAQPFLQDLAADANFHGLALVGIKELSYFRSARGLFGDAVERFHHESPSQRISFQLHRQLSHVLAFLDENYRLSVLVQRLDDGWRAGVPSPWIDVWKLRVTDDDRQSRLWERIEHDPVLRAQAIGAWLKRPAQPITDEIVAKAQAQTRASVAAIRARGGDVVFLRPPSSADLRVLEEQRLPRARGWDPLMAAADLHGLYFADYPAMQNLDLPEQSHMTAACATWYTDAYVRELAALSERVHLQPGASPPAKDCRVATTH